MAKRILCILLAMLMSLGMFAVHSSAAANNGTVTIYNLDGAGAWARVTERMPAAPGFREFDGICYYPNDPDNPLPWSTGSSLQGYPTSVLQVLSPLDPWTTFLRFSEPPEATVPDYYADVLYPSSVYPGHTFLGFSETPGATVPDYYTYGGDDLFTEDHWSGGAGQLKFEETPPELYCVWLEHQSYILRYDLGVPGMGIGELRWYPDGVPAGLREPWRYTAAPGDELSDYSYFRVNPDNGGEDLYLKGYSLIGPNSPPTHYPGQFFAGEAGQTYTFCAVWGDGYKDFTFGGWEHRNRPDTSTQNPAIELVIDIELDKIDVADISTFTMEYTSGDGTTKTIDWTLDGGKAVFVLDPANYTYNPLIADYFPAKFTLTTINGDQLIKYHKIANVKLTTSWWEALPPFMQSILKYLFFGWLWM